MGREELIELFKQCGWEECYRKEGVVSLVKEGKGALRFWDNSVAYPSGVYFTIIYKVIECAWIDYNNEVMIRLNNGCVISL
jgi:hypothetical protein